MTELETGYLNADDPSSGVQRGLSAHGGVFSKDSTSYLNILNVMTGGEVVLEAGQSTSVTGGWANSVDNMTVDGFVPETAVVK